MAWYNTGTVAISGTKVSGVGTNFLDPKFGVGEGQAFLVPGSGTVKMYEIASVEDATHLTLRTTAGTVAAGAAYAVMSFYTDSVPAFAARLAAQLGYYQSQMNGWQNIMTGAGTISITAPDGTVVNISSFSKLTADMAKAYSDGGLLSTTVTPNSLGNESDFGVYFQNSNANAVIANGYPVATAGTLYVTKSAFGCQQMYITFQGETYTRGLTANFTPASPNWSAWVPQYGKLPVPLASGVTGALPVLNGGTGVTTVGGAKVVFGIDGVNSGIVVNQNNIDNYINGLKAQYQIGVVRNNTAIVGPNFNTLQNAACLFAKVSDTWLHLTVPHVGSSPISVLGGYGNVGVTVYRYLWDNFTTTVDTNGFIKKASPIVKLFSDGRTDVSEEARGCSVTRVAKGEYIIEGCSGLNSDAAWGGIDGGFELPKDKNGLPHIWLDYDVSADGSVTVKTYHREHPNAPAFARNKIEGYQDGDPIDIPSDQFVSVRVQMPPCSIFNQETEKAQSYLESGISAPTEG